MDKNRMPAAHGLFIATFLLTVGAAAVAMASGGGGHEAAAGPTIMGLPATKVWDFIWRAMNFAALVVILVKFAAKPVGNMLRDRQLKIKEHFETLEAKKTDADKSYQTMEKKLALIDQEVKKIIETAITQGEAERTRIINEANQAAEAIKRQAEMAVQHEMAAARLMLREEVASQAVMVAEALIKKNLQASDQVKLVEDYLQKVDRIQ